ncbi:MAG TPA: DUF4255 domain-containing protein, partial [Dehalococcoidia bacterium]|nr:DUF4255 domain-containing protein [Dehalococcoidia bacterium]
MANVFAIHSVGSSLVTYLTNSYPEPLRTDLPCTFALLSSGELIDTDTIGTTLSFFLYRVTQNEHLRNAAPVNGSGQGDVPLSLDLHYLMSVWAASALTEHTVLAWAMRELHLHPVLDVSSLSPEAGWTRADVVQLIPAELTNEEIMRIWDALVPPYRLSVSYIARVIRIDPDVIEPGRPVETGEQA